MSHAREWIQGVPEGSVPAGMDADKLLDEESVAQQFPFFAGSQPQPLGTPPATACRGYTVTMNLPSTWPCSLFRCAAATLSKGKAFFRGAGFSQCTAPPIVGLMLQTPSSGCRASHGERRNIRASRRAATG